MSLPIPSSYFCPPPVNTDAPFMYICPILITCIPHPSCTDDPDDLFYTAYPVFSEL